MYTPIHCPRLALVQWTGPAKSRDSGRFRGKLGELVIYSELVCVASFCNKFDVRRLDISGENVTYSNHVFIFRC